jgi:taurine transport system permease protein
MNTKDNVYEYDKAELKTEPDVQTENASFLSLFFEKHRTLAVSIISVGSVVALWFLITALHVVPELFYRVHRQSGKNLYRSAKKAL